jgi:hypothetical protein
LHLRLSEPAAVEPAAGTRTLPKPLTSGAFGKQHFVSLPEEDAYRCPAGERLPYRFTTEEDGKMLWRYWTSACQNCSLKMHCRARAADYTMGGVSICSKLCSSALVQTHKPCASGKQHKAYQACSV